MSDVVVASKPLTATTYTFHLFMGDICATLSFFIRGLVALWAQTEETLLSFKYINVPPVPL